VTERERESFSSSQDDFLYGSIIFFVVGIVIVEKELHCTDIDDNRSLSLSLSLSLAINDSFQG
jgi:hypothetical protein